MKAKSGREVSAVVLVICDRGRREGEGGYLAGKVVELGGIAITVQGTDERSLRELIGAVDVIAIGGSEKTPAEKAILEEGRRSCTTCGGVENVEAWFHDRKAGR